MGNTKIEWTEKVWNPVTGCSKVSQGCKNCYAERIAGRFWGERKFTDVQCHEDRLDEPMHWRKPARVFVNSMSDLFHPGVPVDFLANVFAVMELCPTHTFMVLTKRPERMWSILTGEEFKREYRETIKILTDNTYTGYYDYLPNVWLGVSVEDQAAADERIPLLLKTPAAVRFVSCEPMLGPVNLTRIKWAKIGVNPDNYKRLGVPAPDEIWSLNDALASRPADQYNRAKIGLDWVICGGESGPNARPMHPDWARSLRNQCQEANVPFFFKQWGEWTAETPQGISLAKLEMVYRYDQTFTRVGKKAAGRLLDGREWKEFPK